MVETRVLNEFEYERELTKTDNKCIFWKLQEIYILSGLTRSAAKCPWILSDDVVGSALAG